MITVLAAYRRKQPMSDSVFTHSQDQLQQLARDVLTFAKQMGGSDAAVEISEGSGLSVSVRKSKIETIEQNKDKGMGVTVFIGQRRGNASTSDFSASSLRATVEAAYNIARFTADDDCAGLADADMLEMAPRDLKLFYPWTISTEEAVVLAQRDDWYSSVRDPKKMSTPEAVGRYAAERALARLNARTIDTRTCPVLFEAPLAAGLLGAFVQATSGGALYRKSTFLLDSLGTAVFPSHIQIKEDPHVVGAVGSAPFDEEGVRTVKRDVVKDGVVQGYFLSTYSARKLGMKTTGNAGGSHNLTMTSSKTKKSDDFVAMLKKMGTGLLVTELMGQGTNYVTGDYSRGASGYWVENGIIQYPVEEITIAGNMKDMLAQIVAIGSDVLTRGTKQTGSILIEKMVVAGG